MSSKVADYMVAALKEALEEADTLGAAVWGGIPNVKAQSTLDARKGTLSSDLEKLIRFLKQVQRDVEQLQMVDMSEGEE